MTYPRERSFYLGRFRLCRRKAWRLCRGGRGGCGDERLPAHLHEQRLRANGGPLWYAPGPYNWGMEIHLRHIQALSGCLRYLGVLWTLFFGRDRRARDAATQYVTHQIK